MSKASVQIIRAIIFGFSCQVIENLIVHVVLIPTIMAQHVQCSCAHCNTANDVTVFMGYSGSLYSREYGIYHMQEVGVEEGRGYLIEKGLDGVWGVLGILQCPPPPPPPHQSIIVPVLHDGHLPCTRLGSAMPQIVGWFAVSLGLVASLHERFSASLRTGNFSVWLFSRII